MTSQLTKKFFFIITLLSLLNFYSFSKEKNYSFDMPLTYRKKYDIENKITVYSSKKFNCWFESKEINSDKNVSQSIENYLINNNEEITILSETEYEWNGTNVVIYITLFNYIDIYYIQFTFGLELSKNKQLIISSISNSNMLDENFPIIYSAINSLCINKKYYNNPGIFAEFLKSAESDVNKPVNLFNAETFYINQSEIIDAQTNIELEYALLMKMAKEENFDEAIKRYYRLIYRDNYGRIKPYLKIIIDELEKFYENQNIENNQKNLFIAQSVLSWTQEFKYKNSDDLNSSDFVNLLSTLCGEGNDCDSRSMLVCAVLNYYGIESVLLISNEFKHAMPAIKLNYPGQKIEYDNNEYLMGETTAHLTWGTIAKTFADRSKWIVIDKLF